MPGEEMFRPKEDSETAQKVPEDYPKRSQKRKEGQEEPGQKLRRWIMMGALPPQNGITAPIQSRFKKALGITYVL
jgi:hypothetical protein